MGLPKRRAKIVATIGPSSDRPHTLERMIKAGMNVARLNFSHGLLSEHKTRIDLIRKVSVDLNQPISILLDLQGPKIRTGWLKGRSPVRLIRGKTIKITTRNIQGTSEMISTTYKKLIDDVKNGDSILLDDGKMCLKVVGKLKGVLTCKVVEGGWLREHTGMNLPGTLLSAPAMTRKDLIDLKFGLDHGINAVALSFVRCAEDILKVKKMLRSRRRYIPVIAKIERAEAVENLDEILQVADGVMVARGDLGVELSLEKVPLLQKEIIHKANKAGVIVITATQMLESMVMSPKPTRAEASDVANAIFDGSDAVMLSGETAVGKFPVEVVQVMNRIILEAESYCKESPLYRAEKFRTQTNLAVVHAACHAAAEVGAKAILVFSMTGMTCRMISKLKPKTPIIGLSPNKWAYQQLAMMWGVRPIISPIGRSTDEMIQLGETILLDEKLLRKGDIIVTVSGTMLTKGSTNMMKILKL